MSLEKLPPLLLQTCPKLCYFILEYVWLRLDITPIFESEKLFLLKCLVVDLLFDFDADNDRVADEGGADDHGAPRAHGRTFSLLISQNWEVYQA